MTDISEFFNTIHPSTIRRLEQKRTKLLDPSLEELKRGEVNNLRLTFSQEFKHKIVRPFVNALYPSLELRTNQGIENKLVQECGLFAQGFDFYATEDLITGTVNQLPIVISEIRTANHISRTIGTGGIYSKPNHYSPLNKRQLNAGQRELTEKRSGQSSLQLFNGLFAIINLPVAFEGWITITPKLRQNWFGRVREESQLALSLLTRPKLRTSIDSPEFRRVYNVLGSEPKLVQALLTPKLLNNILGMHKHTEWMALSFIDGHLCIAISEPEDLLEPDIALPITDERQLQNVKADIEHVVQMVDALALSECF